MFSLGDVGIIISKPGVGENSVPSKTWSIMSASRPVLANFDENEIKTILSENECGVLRKPVTSRHLQMQFLSFAGIGRCAGNMVRMVESL